MRTAYMISMGEEKYNTKDIWRSTRRHRGHRFCRTQRYVYAVRGGFVGYSIMETVPLWF